MFRNTNFNYLKYTGRKTDACLHKICHVSLVVYSLSVDQLLVAGLLTILDSFLLVQPIPQACVGWGDKMEVEVGGGWDDKGGGWGDKVEVGVIRSQKVVI